MRNHHLAGIELVLETDARDAVTDHRKPLRVSLLDQRLEAFR
jgi:hypothetical protein